LIRRAFRVVFREESTSSVTSGVPITLGVRFAVFGVFLPFFQ
jgi:hypothetical protein